MPFDPADAATWPPLLRLPLILPSKRDGYAGIIPVSRATWFQGVVEGRFPQPVKLGGRTVAWRKRDILKLMEHGASRRRRGST